MNIGLRHFVFLPLVVAGYALTPCDVQAADLLDVYQLALRSDPTYAASRHALDGALEKLPQARAGLLPQVSGNATRSRTEGMYSFSGSPESERNVNAGAWAIQLSQPVFRAQTWEAYGQAEYLLDQARAQFQVAEQDLILRTSQAYFDYDVARESLRVAGTQITTVEQQLTVAKKGFLAGTNAVTDVHEAQARLDLAKSQRVAASNDVEVKSAELEKIVRALPVDFDLASLSPDASLPPPSPASVQPWIQQALEQSPSVQVQRAAVRVAEKEVAKAEKAYWPTLDLNASYGRNSSTGSNTTLQDYDSRSRAKQVTLQLNVPLYSGGMQQSKIREALASLEQARATQDVAQRFASASVRQAFAGVVNGMAQVEALNSAIQSSVQAVKANQIGMRLGARINVDVLNAQQQLYIAQRDLIKARYEVLMQGLRLKAAAGVITSSDMAALSPLFRVEKPKQ